MRFSRSAWLADACNCSVPIDCTLAETGGAAGAVAAGAVAGAAAGAASSCLEQAASAASSKTGATRRAFANVVTCNMLPPTPR